MVGQSFKPTKAVIEQLNDTCRILYFCFVVKPLLGILLGTNIWGHHNLPNNWSQPFIIVANHNSHLDACTLMNLFPLQKLRQIRPVAAADYFMTNPLLRWVSTVLLNIIPIPRSNITKENNPITKMGQALEAGHSLIIFPEGSRGQPEVMQAFKSGIAHLIKKHPDVPVISVFLKGMGRSLPKGELVLVPFFCDVIIGIPKHYQGSKTEITEALTAEIHQLQTTLTGFYTDEREQETITKKAEEVTESNSDFGLQWINEELWQTTSNWAHHHVMASILGAWAFCEAIFWFILPDFLLLPMTLQQPKRWKLFAVATIFGSLFGALIMMTLCTYQPDLIAQYITRLPFTHITMMTKIEHLFLQFPKIAPLFQAISGVPVKVWFWGNHHHQWMNSTIFLTLILVSRAVRITGVAILACTLSRLNNQWFKPHWLLFLLLYITIFFIALQQLAT